MDIWLMRSDYVKRWGPLNAYQIVNTNHDFESVDYPPLSMVLLFISNKIADFTHISPMLGIKTTILLFYLLAYVSLIYLGIDRKKVVVSVVRLTIIFLSGFYFLYSALAYSYLDIWFVPFAICSFGLYRRKKFFLSGVCLAIAIFIKWQPMILLLPFLVSFVSWTKVKREVSFGQLFSFLKGLLAGGGLLAMFFALNGISLAAIHEALQRTFYRPYLSADALNMNWLVTYMYHKFFPLMYGGIDGQITIIQNYNSPWRLISLALLFVSVLAISYKYITKKKKDIIELARFLTLIGWAYFVLGFGVHENHLVIAITCALCLAIISIQKKDIFLYYFLSYFGLANLMIFMGIPVGNEKFLVDRVFLGFDITLLLALLNVIVFTVFLFEYLHISKKAWNLVKRVLSNKVSLFILSSIASFILLDLLLYRLVQKPCKRIQESRIVHHQLIPLAICPSKTSEFDILYENNSLGLRDEEFPLKKPSNEYRILFLGDSFTEGSGVNLEQSFVKITGRELIGVKANNSIRTINAGLSAYSPILEYLYLTHRGIEMEPDMVVVNLFMNDFNDDRANLKKAHYDDSGEITGVYVELKQHLPTWLIKYLDGRSVSYYLFKQNERYLWKLKGKITSWIKREPAPSYTKSGVDFMPGDADADIFAITRDIPNDEFDDLFNPTMDIILKMKQFLDDRNIPMVLVVIPAGHQVSDNQWVLGREEVHINSGDKFSDKIFSRLNQFSKQRHLPTLNLVYELRNYANNNPDSRLYFDIDGHFSPEGHELAAKSLAEFLKTQLRNEK